MFSKTLAYAFCLFAAFAITSNAAVVDNEKRDREFIIFFLSDLRLILIIYSGQRH